MSDKNEWLTKVLIVSHSFYQLIFANILSLHRSTDTLSSGSNHDVPQSMLSETVFSTLSTKQAKPLSAPMCAYPSAFRPHPVRLHNKHLSNGHYDSGNVPRPLQAIVLCGFLRPV